MERPPHLVIFDLDGTLVDSLAATFTCFQEAVEPALGRRPTREEILARFGPADHRIVASWVGADAAEDAVRRLYACYERELGRVRPVPGAIELIDELRAAGRRTALFTGRGRPSTDRILAAAGLADRLDTTVTGEEAAHPKPAPDGLRLILDRCGENPEDAVYVGDSVLDLDAAAAAGTGFIAALWTGREAALAERSGYPAADSVAALRTLLLGD